MNLFHSISLDPPESCLYVLFFGDILKMMFAMLSIIFPQTFSTVHIYFRFSYAIDILQVSKPSQEAYQNELNIESVERSFILSARSALFSLSNLQHCEAFIKSVLTSPSCFALAARPWRETSGWRPSPRPSTTTRRRKSPSYRAEVRRR